MKLILGTLLSAFSGIAVADTGKATAQFLKVDVGARGAALQGAYSAMVDEASALYWNPAALTKIPSKSVTFMHAIYVESTAFDYLGYGQRLGEKCALGFGVQYFTAGSIPQTDENGVQSGTFKPSDMAFTLGYAHRLGEAGYSAGLAAKFIQSKIVNSASAVAADLAFMTPAYLNNRLSLSLIASNFGGKMKFNNDSESLPAAIRLGSLYTIKENWGLALDLDKPLEDDLALLLGTEYRRQFGRHSVAGRLGFNSKKKQDLGGLGGLAYGLGWKTDLLSVDYALEPFGSLGLNHRVSLSFSFGAQ